MLLLLVPGLASFSPSAVDARTVDAADAAVAIRGGVLFWHDMPYTGMVVAHDAGLARSSTSYRDGVRDGWARAWYGNNQLAYERYYWRGKEDGVHRGWWQDGRARFVYHYHDGLIEGTAREWFPNGLRYREFHYAAGQESGSEQMWYADGRLRANYVVREGRRFGLPGTKGCTGTGSRESELPFYQSSDRTPEWITPGTAAYARIHRVADFALTDQDGATVTGADVAGKIYVASFFYTSCRDLCPRLRSNLARVQAAFRDDDRVLILSHTVAPEHDDTAMLRRYARANGVIQGKWHLLTGPPGVISRLESDSYFAQLPDSVNGEPVRALHSETFVLVDTQGRVRGVYDGSLAYDTERLIADIHTLK
jgi:protein SCO1/2